MKKDEDFLKNTTPEERVEAAIWFFTSKDFPAQAAERTYFIRLGFKLGQADGWQEIAPDWIQAIRK